MNGPAQQISRAQVHDTEERRGNKGRYLADRLAPTEGNRWTTGARPFEHRVEKSVDRGLLNLWMR